VALVHLAARLIHGGFTLLDTQFVTDHLRQFGTVEVDRTEFHKLLEPALTITADFLALPEHTGADEVLDIVARGNAR
jgi:leucyl/phenylalanyl-tRNA--protein transferase